MWQGAAFQAQPRSYVTNFPLVANPLSEGGKWAVSAVDTTVCKVVNIAGVGNIACGTMTGGGFDDSQMILSGFGPSHEIEAVVYRKPGLDTANREVEILLSYTNGYAPFTPSGGTFGTTTAKGYECNVSHDENYANIGIWKGLPALASLSGNAPVWATGDKFRARILYQPNGSATISMFRNDVLFLSANDPSPQPPGNPGIGFFITSGIANDEFGFLSVLARQL